MADNLQLNVGADGSKLATAEVTFSGDTAECQVIGIGYVGGTAESYTVALAAVDAGVVGADVPRVTLASDDPAVAKLTTIDSDTGAIKTAVELIDNAISGAGFNITQFAGAAVPIGAGTEAAALRVTLATNSTGTLTVDTTGTAGLEVIQATAADLNVTEASASAIKDAVELLDNAVDGNYINVNVNAAGTDLAMNAGVLSAQTQRVTIATNDEVNNLLGTIDADTSNIATSLGNLDNAVDGNYINVNANIAGTDIVGGNGSVAAGVQRVTLADDSTGVLATVTNVTTVATVTNLSQLGGTAISMDEGTVDAGCQRVTLATDDDGVAHLSAIQTALEIIDDWDDGSDHCEVILVAGSAAIGKLAANSGIDIGDVDVTSVVPGVGATNLGKARASALGATDTGVAPLAVRNDDLADLAGTDGDYTPIQVDPNGAVYVNQAAAENKSDSGVAAGGAPGTDDMIAAVASRYLLITAMTLIATSTTTNNVYVSNHDNNLFGNSGNPIPLSMDADGDTVAGIVLPYNPAGYFKTDAVEEAVTLNTSAAQDIVWSISWIEMDT